MSLAGRAVLAASFLAIAPLLASGDTGQAPPLVVKRLSERTIVVHGPQPFSPRMTVFASDKGLVVFDSLGTPSQAAAARRLIEREFGRKDFFLLVNTHDHWDHWCGNQVFADATVVSHASCPAEMRRPLGTASHPAPDLRTTVESWRMELAGLDPESKQAEDLRNRIASLQGAYDELGRGFVPTLPTVTFSDRMQIRLGRQTLKLYYTGGFETPDDIVAFVPEDGLVVLGDTFQRRQYFAAFENGIDVPSFTEILDEVLADNVRFAVPGHGDPLSRDELAEIGKYLKVSWEAADVAVRQDRGATRAAAPLSFDAVKPHLAPALIDLESLAAVHAANVEAFRKRILRTPGPCGP